MITSSTDAGLEHVIVLIAPNPHDASLTAAGKTNVIGTAGFFEPSNRRDRTHTYRDYWGLGYMSQTFETLILRFWQVRVRKVFVDVDPRDKDSIKGLNKFSFVEMHSEKNTFGTGIGWCDSTIWNCGGQRDSEEEAPRDRWQDYCGQENGSQERCLETGTLGARLSCES